jgi:oligopeptide transport system substrate-binding protein
VRKALLLAVNRERLVTLRNMNDTVAYTYTPAGLTGSDGTDFISTVSPWYSEDYEANCEEAKKLLAEAGYENGEGFPALRYIVGNNDRKAIAEAVTGDWNHVLGIDTITVETVENFFTARQTGDFDIAYFGWYMDYPDISNMLGTMVTGANDGGYSSEAYDEAYNSAIAEEDEAAQWESYRKCEEILAEDVPVIPFFLPQTTFLFDDASYDGMVYYCGNNFFGYLTAK